MTWVEVSPGETALPWVSLELKAALLNLHTTGISISKGTFFKKVNCGETYRSPNTVSLIHKSSPTLLWTHLYYSNPRIICLPSLV